MSDLVRKAFIRVQLAKMAKDETGATAVEYGLMVALIAVVIIAAVTLLGTQVRETFSEAACSIGGGTWTDGAAGAAGTCAP